MCDVRRTAVRLRRRTNQHERGPGNDRKAERLRRGGHKHVCRDNGAGFILMIDYRSGERWKDRMMPRQVGMLRLAVMVRRLFHAEMHVAHRRSNSADLHEHEKRGGGHPAKHTRIVVNRRGGPHLTFP